MQHLAPRYHGTVLGWLPAAAVMAMAAAALERLRHVALVDGQFQAGRPAAAIDPGGSGHGPGRGGRFLPARSPGIAKNHGRVAADGHVGPGGAGTTDRRSETDRSGPLAADDAAIPGGGGLPEPGPAAGQVQPRPASCAGGCTGGTVPGGRYPDAAGPGGLARGGPIAVAPACRGSERRGRGCGRGPAGFPGRRGNRSSSAGGPRVGGHAGKPIPLAPPAGSTGKVVQASYVAAAPVEWQAHLAAAIQQLEAESEGAGKSDTAVSQQADLRMLYLMAGRRDEALSPIPGAAPAAQDYWSKQLYGLATWLDTDHTPDATRRAAETKRILDEAMTRLGETAPLVVHNLAFCTAVQGFGSITPFKKAEFAPDQEVLLYTEVENYTVEPTPRGFHTALRSSYQILRRPRPADRRSRVSQHRRVLPEPAARFLHRLRPPPAQADLQRQAHAAVDRRGPEEPQGRAIVDRSDGRQGQRGVAT